MQKINRQELNRRFTEVYHLLEEKGEIVKSNRQKSKSAFAENLGTKGHIIGHYLKGNRKITYEQVKRLCAVVNRLHRLGPSKRHASPSLESRRRY